MRYLAIAAVLLSACGNISNDPLAAQVASEDLQFKHALPSPSDVTLDTPDAKGASSGLSASSGLGTGICDNALATDLFCKGHQEVVFLNGFTASVLGIVDFVRTLPPDVRQRDRRVWGPHQDDQHPLRAWMVEVTRAVDQGALTYRWTIQVRPLPRAAFLTILQGSFVPGPGGSAGGVGEFTVNGKNQRALGDSSDLDLLSVRYDLLSATRTIVVDATAPDGSQATFTSDSQSTGAGGWTYEVPFPVDASTTGDISVRLRWNSHHAGRGDARLTIPSGPNAGSAFVRECWGPDLLVTYWEQPTFAQCPQSGCVSGDERLCVYADLFGAG